MLKVVKMMNSTFLLMAKMLTISILIKLTMPIIRIPLKIRLKQQIRPMIRLKATVTTRTWLTLST